MKPARNVKAILQKATPSQTVTMKKSNNENYNKKPFKGGVGVLPEKFSGGVLPASQNFYPIF